MQVDSFTGRVSYLGTGIGNLAAAKRYLRRKFNLGAAREPIVRRPGALFYVTARQGRRSVALLGPYVSHMTAQSNVSRARRILAQRWPDSPAFTAIGTASVPGRPVPTLLGR